MMNNYFGTLKNINNPIFFPTDRIVLKLNLKLNQIIRLLSLIEHTDRRMQYFFFFGKMQEIY